MRRIRKNKMRDNKRVLIHQLKDVFWRFSHGRTAEPERCRDLLRTFLLQEKNGVRQHAARVFLVAEKSDKEEPVDHFHARLELNETYGTFKEKLRKYLENSGIPCPIELWKTMIWARAWDDSKSESSFKYMCKGEDSKTLPDVVINEYSLTIIPPAFHRQYYADRDAYEAASKSGDATRQPTKKLMDHLVKEFNTDEIRYQLADPDQYPNVVHEMTTAAFEFTVNWRRGWQKHFVVATVISAIGQIEQDNPADKKFFSSRIIQDVVTCILPSENREIGRR